MCKCGAWGHGLVVDLAVVGLLLDLIILKVMSNLKDSVTQSAGISDQ